MNRLKNLLRNLNYLSKHSLYDQRENDIRYLTNKILDDGIYEYGLNFNDYKKLYILNKEDSFKLVINSGKSFVRFGDGEINLMKGISHSFQEYDEELVKKLYEILRNNNPEIIVGINRDYYQPHFRANDFEYMRRYSYDFRKFFDENCRFDRTYIDACFTSTSWDKTDFNEKYWAEWKNAFKDKNLLIVCGKTVLDKLNYDVFELARSKKFVYGNNKNSWAIHDQILDNIKKTADKGDLIVFILGMAGKAMIPEITEFGFTAWDVGHLAKAYNAYMNHFEPTQENIHSFFEPD